MQIQPITISESKRFIALERIIEAGRKTFVDVGTALAEIRDSKFYRSDHKTFEEYCHAKWGWTKQHVYRLIECAPIARSNPQVTSVNQARELSKVPAEKRAEVVEVASSRAKSEDRPMTAADITQAALPAPDWQAEANERLAARNATEPTAPDGYSVLKNRVEREFHKFMDKFEASELPEVRRIIRPWVVRS